MPEHEGKINFMEADARLGRAIELLRAAGLDRAWLFNIATLYSRSPASDMKGFEARMSLAGEIERLARHYIWKNYHSPDLGELKTRLSLIQASRSRLGIYIFAREKESDHEEKGHGRPRGSRD